jgi:hypothetical protein
MSSSGNLKKYFLRLYNGLTETRKEIFNERVSALLKFRMKSLKSFHAQQYDDLFRMSPLLFYELVRGRYLYCFLYHLMMYRVFRSQVFDIDLSVPLAKKARDNYIELYKKNYSEYSLKYPNFHSQEHVIMDMEFDGYSPLLNWVQIMEKFHKVFKNLLEHKPDVKWAFGSYLKVLTLKQRKRYFPDEERQYYFSRLGTSCRRYETKLNNTTTITKDGRIIVVYTTSVIRDGNLSIKPGDYCVIDETLQIGLIEEIFIVIVSKTVYFSLSMFKSIGSINECDIIEPNNNTSLFCWNETFPAKVVTFEKHLIYNLWW